MARIVVQGFGYGGAPAVGGWTQNITDTTTEGTVYWVADNTALWNDPANWSNTPEGPSGFNPPDTTDVVVFRANHFGTCVLNTDMTTSGLVFDLNYSGAFEQGASNIHILDSTGMLLKSGYFFGGTGNIRMDGPFILKNMDFTCTQGNIIINSHFTNTGTKFYHNDSTMILNPNNNSFQGGDIHLNTLSIGQDGTGFCELLESTFVEDNISLEQGALKGTGTIHALKDVDCLPNFGEKSANHRATISMDGTGERHLNLSGGILPSFKINKSDSSHVVVMGTGPVIVNGDLIVENGTLNTNGHGLSVGL